MLAAITEGNEAVICTVESCRPRSLNATSVRSIAFSPDSQQVITSMAVGTIQAWEASNAKLIETPEQEYLQAFSLATSSQHLALGAEDKIHFVGVNGNGEIPAIETSAKEAILAFNQDGSLLASATPEGRISIWKYQAGQFTLVTDFATEQAASLSFNPNGTRLAIGTARNVFIIDVTSGKEVARIPHTDLVSGVSYAPDGNYLATVSSKVLQFWETAKLRLVEIESDREALIAAACARLFENLSESEWKSFFPGEAYQPLCENLP
jgi:WD40 repeat protein